MPNWKHLLAGMVAGLESQPDRGAECARPRRGPFDGYIPNVVVRTHENQKALFYDDLLLRGMVLVHCVSVSEADHCPALKTLTQAQHMLGERLGREVFIYTITTDPDHDTPWVLREHARKMGAKKGWLFLTGAATDLGLVRQRLFTHTGGDDCSTSMIRYGNESAGLWGGITASAGPATLIERLAWITPRERPAGPCRRGGPFAPAG